MNNNTLNVVNNKKVLIDFFKEKERLAILEDIRLRKILGPFRNILPKLLLTKEELSLQVESSLKKKLKDDIIKNFIYDLDKKIVDREKHIIVGCGINYELFKLLIQDIISYLYDNIKILINYIESNFSSICEIETDNFKFSFCVIENVIYEAIFFKTILLIGYKNKIDNVTMYPATSLNISFRIKVDNVYEKAKVTLGLINNSCYGSIDIIL